MVGGSGFGFGFGACCRAPTCCGGDKKDCVTDGFDSPDFTLLVSNPLYPFHQGGSYQENHNVDPPLVCYWTGELGPSPSQLTGAIIRNGVFGPQYPETVAIINTLNAKPPGFPAGPFTHSTGRTWQYTLNTCHADFTLNCDMRLGSNILATNAWNNGGLIVYARRGNTSQKDQVTLGIAGPGGFDEPEASVTLTLVQANNSGAGVITSEWLFHVEIVKSGSSLEARWTSPGVDESLSVETAGSAKSVTWYSRQEFEPGLSGPNSPASVGNYISDLSVCKL